jgi:hypothetical protein
VVAGINAILFFFQRVKVHENISSIDEKNRLSIFFFFEPYSL